MTGFQVMASNDLRTGRVVYLASDGQWSADFQRALRLSDETAVLSAQQQSGAAVEQNQVIDPYLVKVTADESVPSHIRERIRRSGPTCLLTRYTSDANSQRIAG